MTLLQEENCHVCANDVKLSRHWPCLWEFKINFSPVCRNRPTLSESAKVVSLAQVVSPTLILKNPALYKYCQKKKPINTLARQRNIQVQDENIIAVKGQLKWQSSSQYMYTIGR